MKELSVWSCATCFLRGCSGSSPVPHRALSVVWHVFAEHEIIVVAKAASSDLAITL